MFSDPKVFHGIKKLTWVRKPFSGLIIEYGMVEDFSDKNGIIWT